MSLPVALRASRTIAVVLLLAVPHLTSARAAEPVDKSTPAAQKLAASLVLPKLRVDDVTLKEAMDELRETSIKISPRTNGLKIVLSPEALANATKISIFLRDISLSEAIRYVALMAKSKCTFDAKGVFIEPASDAELLKARPTLVKKKGETALARTRRFIIPELEFRKATLGEAHRYLRSEDHGDEGDMRTINLVLVPGGPETRPSTSSEKTCRSTTCCTRSPN